MQAYKFSCGGVTAIMMAEDDEAVMTRCFAHLNEARSDFYSEKDPELIAKGGIWRLGEEDDEPVSLIEVWTNEVKFVPPEGTVQ